MVVVVVWVGVGAEGEGGELFVALPGDPGVDDVLGDSLREPDHV